MYNMLQSISTLNNGGILVVKTAVRGMRIVCHAALWSFLSGFR